MGRKDWQQMDSKDDLAAIGISPHRGRGWRVLSGILLVGMATFTTAYYLPLYRAHAALRQEYRTLSSQANTQHKQLTDTLDTLKQVSTERDHLHEIAGNQRRNSDALLPQAESLEHDLQTSLKKYLGQGKLQLVRQSEKLRITMASPLLVAATGADLTDAGKKALCLVGGTIKSADVRVVVEGYGAGSMPRNTAAWQVAATRAGNAAQLLGESCGVDSSRIEVQVSNPMPSPDGTAILLEITPR